MSGSLDVMAPGRASQALAGHPLAAPPVRRVRHELRDGLLVMAFSLVMSSLVALVLVLSLGAGGN